MPGFFNQLIINCQYSKGALFACPLIPPLEKVDGTPRTIAGPPRKVAGTPRTIAASPRKVAGPPRTISENRQLLPGRCWKNPGGSECFLTTRTDFCKREKISLQLQQITLTY
jgi:hypothetical protein